MTKPKPKLTLPLFYLYSKASSSFLNFKTHIMCASTFFFNKKINIFHTGFFSPQEFDNDGNRSKAHTYFFYSIIIF